MILAQATLSATVATIYSVPANRAALPTVIFVSNLSASASLVDIYLVRSADTLAERHLVFSKVSLEASECKMISIPEGTSLLERDSIAASATGLVNLHVIGDETNV